MQTSLHELQSLYRKCRLFVFSVLLLLITALAIAFVNRYVSFVLVAAALTCDLLALRPCQKQYASAVTQANLDATICKQLDTHDVQEKGGRHITEETIKHALMMPCGDENGAPLLRWELHGEKNQFPISLCDATIPQKFKLSGKGKSRVHFDSGVWAHIELPTDTQKQIRLLDETSVPTPIRMDYFAKKQSFETMPINDTDIAQRFVLYCPRNTEQQPSAAFLRELKALMNYTPGYVAVSVQGSQMDVFIRGRFLSRPVSISKAPAKELLTFDPFPELDYLIKLADATRY